MAAASTPRPVPTTLHFVAGGIAGTVAATMTMPLDVARTRMQATAVKSDSPARFFATYAELRSVVAREGGRGLFRGLAPVLFGVGPMRAVYFASYSRAKRELQQWTGRDGLPVHMGAGGVAGFMTYTAGNPIWLVKTRLQVDVAGAAKYRGAWDCVQRVYTEEGLRGFFKGVTASYLGIAEYVIQFAMYESLKEWRTNQRGLSGSQQDPAAAAAQTKGTLAWATDTMWTSGISKLVASVCTYPHEVLRTRLRQQRANEASQLKYRGIVSGFGVIFAEEGMRGLYRGMGAHLLRAVPNTAMLFLTYEILVEAVTKYQNKQLD